MLNWLKIIVIIFLTFLRTNYFICERRLKEGSFNSKTSFKISEDKLLFILKISVVRTQSYLSVIAQERWICSLDFYHETFKLMRVVQKKNFDNKFSFGKVHIVVCKDMQLSTCLLAKNWNMVFERDLTIERELTLFQRELIEGKVLVFT